MRGYFGIALYHPSKEPNIGNVLRTAYNFGASFVSLITKQKINLEKLRQDTPKSSRHMPVFIYEDYESFYKAKPKNCRIVCIEINEESKNLMDVSRHHDNVIYLFGPEIGGLPKDLCHSNECYFLPTKLCLNLATTAGIVMYDRYMKNNKNEKFNLPKSRYIKDENLCILNQQETVIV